MCESSPRRFADLLLKEEASCAVRRLYSVAVARARERSAGEIV